MSAIRGLHHVGLHVTDLKRSEQFYVGIVGFEPLFSWNPRAPYINQLTGYVDVDLHATILQLPGTSTSLEIMEYRNVDQIPARAADAQPGTAHLAFYVDDLESIYAQWTSRGVRAVSAPVTPTIGPNEGGRVVYMLDPDGYRLELIESRTSFAEFAHEHG